jgi:hypothetical protein
MATYLAGTDATVTIDGTPMAVTDGNYECTVATDEVTNLNSGGFFSSVNTVKKATASLTCVYDGDAPPDFDEGDTVAIVLAIPSGPGISGNFNVIKMAWPSISPSAAVKYSFDLESNGSYVKTGGAP